MKIPKLCIATICIICSVSCAPVRTIIPIEKEASQITASLGGPLIEFSGAMIPIPLTSVNYSRGISEKITLNTAIHTTSLLFGVFQIEGSATTFIWSSENMNMGITTSPGFYYMSELKKQTTRLYPMLDLNFYFRQKNKPNFMYASVQQMLELSRYKAFEQQPDSRYIPSVAAGYTISREKMNYTFELKYMSFLQSNENIVVDYISPIKKGTLGIQIGFTRKF